MYTYKEKNKAIDLLIELNIQYTKTIVYLGYPERKTLGNWYKHYIKFGYYKDAITKRIRFSEDEKKIILDYYYKIGRNISLTVKHFGYPARATLSNWINENDKNHTKHCLSDKPVIKYNNEIKKDITKTILLNNTSVYDASKDLGITPVTLYNWRKKLLTSPGENMSKKIVSNSEIIENIEKEYNELKLRYNDLQLEYDILLKAQEILKKEIGISLNELSNKEKADITYALKDKYQLKLLLNYLNCSKSTYFYHIANLNKLERYAVLRKEMKLVFESNYSSFGYRRLYDHFKKTSLKVSEKVIRRLMKEENIVVISYKKKKYSSYLGEISPAVPNIVNRDFHSNEPNQKWLTDITEFHIPSGKVYLSPIIDCHGGYIVSWTTGTSPNADLANTMLEKGIETLKDGENPIIHNDRGSHYRWPEWINIVSNHGLTRSMSKKGCSPDNSACEGFFGRIKNEFFYKRNWSNISITTFIDLLNEYLNWYNLKRPKRSLNGLTPNEYRNEFYK